MLALRRRWTEREVVREGWLDVHRCNHCAIADLGGRRRYAGAFQWLLAPVLAFTL